MNVLVVDTSVWISYFRGENNDDIDCGLKEGRVYLPPLVLAELTSGKITSRDRARLEQFLRELPICQNDFDHWARVGRLRSDLLSKGFSISTPDAHIAQCTLDLSGYLLTKDSIFKKIADQVSLSLI